MTVSVNIMQQIFCNRWIIKP